ncbi:hypothetical protein KBX49_01760 [Liquorilactobacillus satsumensis]|uniref:hypothetical protein n=1 Tax=Liquorilactobacillus satsumensis TaxID=259059 RepID=UPI0021C46603|nr:hypothetical protein [Liquorilactobacillus satsumensis]MCP9356706.1 hypothetical protein [Liquorilactobacillus satsumensis]MCP9370646.1 hypothetical protein [Liquorilactobacillus satsumensis]
MKFKKLLRLVKKYNQEYSVENYHTLEVCGTDEIYVYLKSKNRKEIACISRDGISFADEGIFFVHKELKLLLKIMRLIRS